MRWDIIKKKKKTNLLAFLTSPVEKLSPIMLEPIDVLVCLDRQIMENLVLQEFAEESVCNNAFVDSVHLIKLCSQL
jgi:hypothetical protein